MPINILKTNLKNLEKDINLSQIGMENDKNVNLNFDTLDKVYIESSSNIQDLTDAERITSVTDFAIISGCASPSWAKAENGKPGAQIWLRDLSLNTLKLTPAIKVIKEYGTITSSYAPNVRLGVCPCLSVDIDQLLPQNNKPHTFKISSVGNDDNKYYTIEIASFQYPQTIVDREKEQELDLLFKRSKLAKTGKTFIEKFKSKQNKNKLCEEYEHNGTFYIRTNLDTLASIKDTLSCERKIFQNNKLWVEVKPIKWKILNWNELPWAINPNGNGTAKTLTLRSEEAIFSASFNYSFNKKKPFTSLLWQNSEIRAYLNGYNLHEEILSGNGNKDFLCEQNFDYKNSGFLNEIDHSNFLTQTSSSDKIKKNTLDGSNTKKSMEEIEFLM